MPIKVLFFFPKSIAQSNAGSKTRALYLLRYFKSKSFEVDYVGLSVDESLDKKTVEFLKSNQLAANVFLLKRKPHKTNILSYLFKYKIQNLIYNLLKWPSQTAIAPFLTIYLKNAFERILKDNQYNYIIVSYADCADLISNKKLTSPAKTILDTHDFLTAQFKSRRNFKLGVTFQDEIERLNLFDEVWAISVEEQYVFKQFSKAPVRLVSMMMDAPQVVTEDKKYDLIYVAGDNPHNIRAIQWFFKQVYPLLSSGLKFCIIGDIVNYIPNVEGISKIPVTDCLDMYYRQAKVAICPMLSGTGIKVKVVEALAYGMPVVCSLHGIDGLANKINNGCLVSDKPIDFAKNINVLLSDAEVYRQHSLWAKEYFLKCHETSVSFKMLDEAFDGK